MADFFSFEVRYLLVLYSQRVDDGYLGCKLSFLGQFLKITGFDCRIVQFSINRLFTELIDRKQTAVKCGICFRCSFTELFNGRLGSVSTFDHRWGLIPWVQVR